MGTLKTTNIQTITGSGTLTLGTSGETLALGSGVTSNLMYPAFEVILSSDQSITSATDTKVQFDTEIFDTDSAYDTSNYRFTVPSGKSGKYFIYNVLGHSSNTDSTVNLVYTYIYKNGSTYRVNHANFNSNHVRQAILTTTLVLDLSVNDYIEIYGRIVVSGGTPSFDAEVGAGKTSCFGGYRIGS